MTERNQLIAAFAIIFNDQGKILLGQRLEPDPTHKFHNKWSAPGGIVDFEEEPTQTAVREAQEEAGVVVAIQSNYPIVQSHVYTDTYSGKKQQSILLFYAAKYLSGEPTAINDKGTNDVKWFDLEEIDPDKCIVEKDLIEKLRTHLD